MKALDGHGAGAMSGVVPLTSAVADCGRTAMDVVAVNPRGTLFVSGDMEDWGEVRRPGIGAIVDIDGAVAKLEALGRLLADTLPPRRVSVETP